MTVHHLKIWPQYFEAVKDGSKTFEVRENDRGFQKGELVHLKEWDPTGGLAPIGYTRREIIMRIGYVLPIDKNTVVFSLLVVVPE